MGIETLIYFMMLSVAVERGIAIVKHALPWLDKKDGNTIRKFLLLVLPVVLGAGIAYFLREAIQTKTGITLHTAHFIIMGILLGGGSGFWYDALTYVKTVQSTADTMVTNAANKATETAKTVKQ